MLGCALFAVYSINGRQIGVGDTLPNLLLPVALLRGDGVALDRFADRWKGKLPYCVTIKRGQIVSRYPLAPALLNVPLTLPQLALVDAIRPQWETHTLDPVLSLMGKNSAAALVALSGVATYQLLLALGLGQFSLLAALIAGLGSTLWVVASQSPWQHGPAALFLALTLLVLVPVPMRRWRSSVAGLCAALVVACRPQDLVLVLPIAIWVVRQYGRGAAWFFVFPLLVGAAIAGVNVWYFGTPLGGYAELADFRLPSHDAARFWTTEPLYSAAGTLFSPSRGLFVYMPWTALALAALPATYRRIATWSLLRAALWSLVLFFALLCGMRAWWAGWTFGPRYWTDAVPLFAILVGFALEWSWRRSRSFCALLLAAAAFSVGVEAIGAVYYPSTWNQQLLDEDTLHHSLWNWHDTELARCLHEGPHRPELW
jgi:hypothetical protein